MRFFTRARRPSGDVGGGGALVQPRVAQLGAVLGADVVVVVLPDVDVVIEVEVAEVPPAEEREQPSSASSHVARAAQHLWLRWR